MSKATNVIAAAAAGFVAGILLAPKSGVETRKDIKNKALEAKGYAGDRAQQVKAAAREAGGTLKKGVENVGAEADGMVKSARHSAEKVAHEAVRLGDEAKTRANRAVEETKHTASHVQKDAEKHLR